LEVQQITAAWNTPFVECSICSEQFCTQDCITSLPCAHVFHAGCIRPWLLSFSDSCPLCRQAVGGGSTVSGGLEAPRQSIVDVIAGVWPGDAAPPRSQCGELAEAHHSARGLSSCLPLASPCEASTASGQVHVDSAIPSARGPELEADPAGHHTGAYDMQRRINDMCRRSIGLKSREAESKLAAWKLIKERRAASRAQEQAAHSQLGPSTLAATGGGEHDNAIPNPCPPAPDGACEHDLPCNQNESHHHTRSRAMLAWNESGQAGIHAGGRVHAYVRVKLTASSCKEDGVKLTVQLESDIDRKAQGMANQPLSGAQLSQGLGTPAYRQQVEPAPENSPRSRETPCRDDKKSGAVCMEGSLSVPSKTAMWETRPHQSPHECHSQPARASLPTSEPADFADSDGCGDVWDLDCNITVSAMPYM